MKTILCLFVTPIIIATTPLLADDSRGKEVEVEINKVYIPKKGFDDNDNIEAIAVGDLPNPCFTLSHVYAEKTTTGFTVHQMAWKSEKGLCRTGDLIEDPVPFASPVAIGQLDIGSYVIGGDGSKKRSFEVGEALTTKIDNFNYAIIRSVSSEQYYYNGDPITFEVRGLLPDCTKLEESPNVEVLDDTILVLPIVKKSGEPCIHYAKPFKKSYTVGPLRPGSYLIHVRSRGGNAAYQPFNVWKERR